MSRPPAYTRAAVWLYVHPVSGYDAHMLWNVVPSREKGVLIPTWQSGRFKPHQGRLVIESRDVAHLRRVSMVAHLIDSKLHDLWDCQLVYCNGGYIVLSGYNHVEDVIGGSCDYAQSWVVTTAREWLGGQGTGYT